jgi:hypothetical protein
VFAPSLLKLSDIEKRIASMAVKIPTRQVIPTAMIINVSSDLSKLAFMDINASLIFSFISKSNTFFQSLKSKEK